MPYIRHESLFTLQDLFEMERKHRFEAIFATLDITPVLRLVRKKSRYGAPIEVNYSAMVYSLIARIVERIPAIKDLLKRLREDILFRLDCGFSLAEALPSAATYSRLMKKMSQGQALEEIQEHMLKQVFSEGFISDNTVAIDATHIEARDQAPAKQEKEKAAPKKRGRKSKQDREAWLKQKQAEEEQKPIFEKEIAAQLAVPYAILREQIPLSPQWGVKKNSEGKNLFWYGYKGHLAVGAQSQYILGALLSSGSLNDGKAAIPLLKGIAFQHPIYKFKYATMDAGYDYEPIYQEVRKAKANAVIAYNRRREPELIGFDEHFAPSPLARDSLCQKVYKMKITVDLRKYTAPARGTTSWKQIAKQRSAVERVNAYLKEYFQLNNVRHRSGERAKVHFNLVTLVYNCTKLACDRLNKQFQLQAA